MARIALVLAVPLLLAACSEGGAPTGTATEPADAASFAWNTRSGEAPLVIAHRGASGERPEHTEAAYALALEQGATCWSRICR